MTEKMTQNELETVEEVQAPTVEVEELSFDELRLVSGGCE